MKRIIALTLAVLMALTLCACGGNGSGQETPAPSPSPTAAPTETPAPTATPDVVAVEDAPKTLEGAECTPENMENSALLIESFCAQSGITVTHTILEESNLIVINTEMPGLDAQLQDAKKSGQTPSNWDAVISGMENLNSVALKTAQLVCGEDVHVAFALISDVDHDTVYLTTLDGKCLDDTFA